MNNIMKAVAQGLSLRLYGLAAEQGDADAQNNLELTRVIKSIVFGGKDIL